MEPFECMTLDEQIQHQLWLHGGVVVLASELRDEAAAVHAHQHERGADHQHEQPETGEPR
jgi:hypothetical protein